ncbi:MAG: zinc dependent phospholipase C family protein [Bacilli bacterium]|nr:zinc dependent phospholipase C family protein [Bacilli bacterium]
MASSMIHIAVANEINKKLNRDKSKLLIGTIAPDISKLIGETKVKSHFQDRNDNIPNLDKFLNKYKENLNDDFVLGYYIHLLTDYLWFKYFMTEIKFEDTNIITKLDGTNVKCNGNMFTLYVYNDYTNLNIKLIDEYDLDLKIFYNEIPKLESIIQEIPMEKIGLIVDKAGEIVENTKEHKDFVFNLDNINKFIETSVDIILGNLKELNIYK